MIKQVSWIYPPELFPLRVRGKAVALTTASNWCFNFALSYFVPPAFVNIQWRTYLIFGCFNVAMFVHVFLCFPEVCLCFDVRRPMILTSNRPRARLWNRWKRSSRPRPRHGRLESNTRSLVAKRQVISTRKRSSAIRRTLSMQEQLLLSREQLEWVKIGRNGEIKRGDVDLAESASAKAPDSMSLLGAR
jgi:MFS family permease